MSATQNTQPKLNNEPRQRGGEPRLLADILEEVLEELKAKNKARMMQRETAMLNAENRDFETPETRQQIKGVDGATNEPDPIT